MKLSLVLVVDLGLHGGQPGEWSHAPGMARIGCLGKLLAAYGLFIALWWDVSAPMAGTESMLAEPTCTLSHRVFTSFGAPLFRHAETDGTPVMVVMLGEK